MYDTESGTLMSKGEIGSELSTLAVHDNNALTSSNTVAAAHSSGEIVLLGPHTVSEK